MVQLRDPPRYASVADPSRPPDPKQGVIEEARQRRRRRHVGMAAAVLALGAGLIAVLLSGGSGAGKHSLLHFRPRAAVPPRSSAPGLGHMRLSPSLQGGQAGWCVAWTSSGGGGCGALPLRDSPIFGGVLVEPSRLGPPSHSGPPAPLGPYKVTVLTIPAALAVAVGHEKPVPTRPTGLPYGYRFAVVPTASASPSIVAFDAHGHRIGERFEPSLAGPASFWQRPERPPPGLCQLSARGLHGLTAEWGHVVSRVAAYRGVVGRIFQSCVDTEYYLDNWPLETAILLDAEHPGGPPGPLPGMTPVPGVPQVFNAPGALTGNLTAERRSNAWLVVAGGSGPAQRLAVLRHLQATIRL
jgi:hypothetical protein